MTNPKEKIKENEEIKQKFYLNRYGKGRDNDEVYDLIEKAINNINKQTEKDILSGKYCVKLVSQGKEMGRKEAIKEILEIIEKVINRQKGEIVKRKLIETLKSKIQTKEEK